MADDHFKIAIVGSGPGGMSAAAHAAELGVSHVEHLTDIDTGRGGLQLVEKELEITDDDKLPHPSLLDATGLGDLDVAFVGSPDTARRIDAERPLGLVRRDRTGGGHLLPALDVAGEAADLADDALACESDHEGGAVVALQRRGERPDKELVGFGFGPNLDHAACGGRVARWHGGRGHLGVRRQHAMLVQIPLLYNEENSLRKGMTRQVQVQTYR